MLEQMFVTWRESVDLGEGEGVKKKDRGRQTVENYIGNSGRSILTEDGGQGQSEVLLRMREDDGQTSELGKDDKPTKGKNLWK